MSRTEDGTPAAERTVAVLRHLAAAARPVSAGALARDLGLPRSSTYRLLATLEAARFVVHLPEEQRWTLGVGAFELGAAYLRAQPLERLARPLLHRLAHDTGVAAHLGVLDGRDVLYLVKEQPPHPHPLVTEVGVRLPAHLTASGRAILAALSPAQLHALLPPGTDLSTRTGLGPTSPRALRRRLDEVRTTGHATEDGEVVADVRALAVAVHDATGRPLAAVTLVGHLPLAELEAHAPAVGATAGELTRRLGGRPRPAGPTSDAAR
ncbi:MAG: IclR family transcriptional regulator [Actinomycetes bacterium]